MSRWSTHVVVLAAAIWAVGGCLASAAFDSSASSALAVSTLTLGSVSEVAGGSGDGCATVDVSWASASGADAYVVDVSRDAGPWIALVAEPSAPRGVTDTGSTGSGQVRYRVTPVDAASGWSGPPATSTSLACA